MLSPTSTQLLKNQIQHLCFTGIGILGIYLVLLLAVFVLALPKTFAKTCSHVLPHNGLKFGTSQDAKL